MNDAPVRLLRSGSLAFWLSNAGGQPATEDRLRDHERVVRTALVSATPLPLRFGSLFATDLDAIEVLDRRRVEFETALDRLDGKFEMGLRVCREVKAESAAVLIGGQADADRPDAPASGREYLERRKSALAAQEHARTEAEEALATVAGFVSEPGFPATHTVLLQDDLIGTVAHLVQRARVRHYQHRIDELRRSRPDLRFEVSGPWAPYSFV